MMSASLWVVPRGCWMYCGTMITPSSQQGMSLPLVAIESSFWHREREREKLHMTTYIVYIKLSQHYTEQLPHQLRTHTHTHTHTHTYLGRYIDDCSCSEARGIGHSERGEEAGEDSEAMAN